MNIPENNPYPMHVGIIVTSEKQLAAVYAVLAGVSTNAVADRVIGKSQALAAPYTPSEIVNPPEPVEEAPVIDDSEVDAHGWPWSADMHASTRTQTKEGLWRMKVGVTRPDPKPGFPIEDAGSTSTASTGETASSQSEVAPTPTASVDEADDEFAAFRAASEKVDAAAASASVPARKWTDADLGALAQ